MPGATETDTFQLKNSVEIYGGFEGLSGTEDNFGVRDVGSFLSILSGDIEGNDTTSAKGIVTDTANITGQNSDHVVTGDGTDGTAVLDGFTITGGQAGPEASFASGGGMSNESGSPTLTNLTFSGNSAEGGGGMNNCVESAPTLTNVTFIANTATFNGGGLRNDCSDPSLKNVVFSGNSAGTDGGGMINDFSDPKLTNVIFSGNSATSGGAMLNRNNSSPTLTNTTFSRNTATDQNTPGGGMRNLDSAPIIQNSIFWGNSDSFGDGVGAQIFNSPGNPTIANSLVRGSGGSGGGWSPNLGNDDGGNVDAEPMFLDADGIDNMAGTLDDDLSLQPGSPAVDMGDNAADLDGGGPGLETISDIPTDLAGNPRIFNGTVDMGAFESQVLPLTATPTEEGGPTVTLTVTPTTTQTPTQTVSGLDTPTSTPTGTQIQGLSPTPSNTPTDGPSPTVTNTIGGNVASCDLDIDDDVDADDLIMLLESDPTNPDAFLFFARCWFEQVQ